MMDTMVVFSILAVILTIVAVVLTYVFIMPAKKRHTLGKFTGFLHDLFHFKSLLLEKVLRACYMIATYFCIFYGFFNLFNFYSYDSYWGGSYVEWYGWQGLLMMILGPIFIRLGYELMMMLVLLVKNVMQINNKLKNQNTDSNADIFNTPVYTTPVYTAPTYAEPAYTAPAAPVTGTFCTKCGATLNADGTCPQGCE